MARLLQSHLSEMRVWTVKPHPRTLVHRGRLAERESDDFYSLLDAFLYFLQGTSVTFVIRNPTEFKIYWLRLYSMAASQNWSEGPTCMVTFFFFQYICSSSDAEQPSLLMEKDGSSIYNILGPPDHGGGLSLITSPFLQFTGYWPQVPAPRDSKLEQPDPVGSEPLIVPPLTHISIPFSQKTASFFFSLTKLNSKSPSSDDQFASLISLLPNSFSNY